jgi:hypothetical protein
MLHLCPRSSRCAQRRSRLKSDLPIGRAVLRPPRAVLESFPKLRPPLSLNWSLSALTSAQCFLLDESDPNVHNLYPD